MSFSNFDAFLSWVDIIPFELTEEEMQVYYVAYEEAIEE